jgi:hypothetical protein
MALLGKHIKLSGISQKGKNRIREHGDHWVVLAETDKILFNPEPGPWIFTSPVGRGQNDKASRWIRANNDPDFLIEEYS